MWNVGDHAWYILSKGPGRPRALWGEAVIIATGGSRIGIRTVFGVRPRYVSSFSLTTNDPPADADVRTFVGEVSAWP